MNTDRGLLFLTLGLGCVWLVLDEFFGDKRISNIADMLTPNFSFFNLDLKLEDKEKSNENYHKATEKNQNSDLKPKPKKHIQDVIDHFYEGNVQS